MPGMQNRTMGDIMGRKPAKPMMQKKKKKKMSGGGIAANQAPGKAKFQSIKE